MSDAQPYPRWIDSSRLTNLREVAPGVYVGGKDSTRYVTSVHRIPFSLVVDLYGSSGWMAVHPVAEWADYLGIPFSDGAAFPEGALDRIYEAVLDHMPRGPVLIHCQAGLSRSASAAYAVIRQLYKLSHDQALARVKIYERWPLSETLRSAREWVA